jgi:hypothetical protein
MSGCPALDCANALQVPPPLQPNPDISGIGVRTQCGLFLWCTYPRRSSLDSLLLRIWRGFCSLYIMYGSSIPLRLVLPRRSAQRTPSIRCLWSSSRELPSVQKRPKIYGAMLWKRYGDWLPDDQPAMSGTPALCMFDYSRSPPESVSWITMLFSILVLSISYTTRAIKLFKWSSETSRSFFPTTPGNALKKHLGFLYTGSQKTKANKWILSTPYYVILAAFLVIRSWMDFLESVFWEVR